MIIKYFSRIWADSINEFNEIKNPFRQQIFLIIRKIIIIYKYFIIEDETNKLAKVLQYLENLKNYPDLAIDFLLDNA